MVDLSYYNFDAIKKLLCIQEVEEGQISQYDTTNDSGIKLKGTGFKLPDLRGPYDVGFVDLEWRSTTTSPSLKNVLAETNQEVLARWYYPVKKGTNTKDYYASWLPSKEYTSAYSGLFQIKEPLGWLAGKALISSAKIPASEGVMPCLEKLLPRLLVFSHGMGGMRTTNSAYCTQLASFGYIVAAVEHRDGSACLTFTEGQTVAMPYQHLPPSEYADDTAVEGEKWRKKAGTAFAARFIGHHAWRSHQIRMRAAEIRACIDLALHWDSQSVKWVKWSPTANVEDILDAIFKRPMVSIDITGHSFGGSSAMYASGMDTRVRMCIALDPWCYALPEGPLKDWINHSPKAESPDYLRVVVINSNHDLFQWPENLARIAEFLRATGNDRTNISTDPVSVDVPSSSSSFVRAGTDLSVKEWSLFELQGATHQDFADFICLIPPWIWEFVRYAMSKLHPHVALLEIVYGTLSALGDKNLEEADARLLPGDVCWAWARSQADVLPRPLDYLPVLPATRRASLDGSITKVGDESAVNAADRTITFGMATSGPED